MNSYQQPDTSGHFGPYGGSFVSETLTHAIQELREAYARYSRVALAKVQAVLEGFQQGLPREYAPGLMLERVAFEGPALVMTIRALSRSVPEAGDSSEVARAEKALMLPLCDYPDVVFLLSRGVVLKRRFIDSQDRMFFEITLAAADCRR